MSITLKTVIFEQIIEVCRYYKNIYLCTINLTIFLFFVFVFSEGVYVFICLCSMLIFNKSKIIKNISKILNDFMWFFNIKKIKILYWKQPTQRLLSAKWLHVCCCGMRKLLRSCFAVQQHLALIVSVLEKGRSYELPMTRLTLCLLKLKNKKLKMFSKLIECLVFGVFKIQTSI